MVRLHSEGNLDLEERYVYDGQRIALRFVDPDGDDPLELASRYLHGPAIDQILADEQITTPGSPGEVLWPLTDHLGSVRDLAVFDDQPSQTTIANGSCPLCLGALA